MKRKYQSFATIIFVISLVISGFSAANAGGSPASNEDLTPVSFTTKAGSTNNMPVNTLAVIDQTGTNDNPEKYVRLNTPGVTYRGTQTFIRPENVNSSDLQSITLKVNFKAPANTKQKWTWSMYNWNVKKWTLVGTSENAKVNTWTMLSFSVLIPQNFIDTSGRINVRVQSSNANGDAKIDYTSIHLTKKTTTAVPPQVQPTTTQTAAPTQVQPTPTQTAV